MSDYQVGPRSCGKTSLVHLVSQLTGNKLEVMAMNSAMDTTELLGGFEQVRKLIGFVYRVFSRVILFA